MKDPLAPASRRPSLLRRLGALTLLSTLAGCALSTPFRGPGFDSSRGLTGARPDDTIVLAISHAVADPARRGPFDEGTRRVMASMSAHEGLIGWSVRRELFGNEAWTMTAWKSDADRARFVASQVHARAMAEGMPVLRSVRFRRLEIRAGELPIGWDRAIALLDEESRSYGGGAAARD